MITVHFVNEFRGFYFYQEFSQPVNTTADFNNTFISVVSLFLIQLPKKPEAWCKVCPDKDTINDFSCMLPEIIL